MRILHSESSCGWGGQEIRILTEMAGMQARGHQVHLLACPQSNILREALAMGLSAQALPLQKKRPSGLWALRQWLRAQAPSWDVINTHSSTDAWLMALAGQTVPAMPPIVRTRHVSTPVANNAATRWLYTQATAHIVTTGERLRQQLHRDHGFALAQMTSVPTGIDLQRYVPGAAAAARQALALPERPTLGIVATLRSWKGHSDLLQVWARLRLRFPDWQLLIVGDGPQRQALSTQIQTLGAQGEVHMVGNREDVQRWLMAMDVFVLPSYGNEGVPQGIMQAMAAGLPVVSTTVGAIDEAVQASTTGLLVPPRDLAALEAALAQLMASADLRQQLGQAGQQRAQTHFGVDVMLDAMTDIFAQAIAGMRPPR